MPSTGGLKQQTFISHRLEAEKSKFRVSAWSGSDKVLFLVCCLLAVSSCGGEQRSSLVKILLKILIPF